MTTNDIEWHVWQRF